MSVSPRPKTGLQPWIFVERGAYVRWGQDTWSVLDICKWPMGVVGPAATVADQLWLYSVVLEGDFGETEVHVFDDSDRVFVSIP